ncbi:unnamed protein product [Symbiodinium necroappetens]|uniref:C3H1-type domain-containing protein n=1 Tax=Symbiodinium necroappetens TaxID=1628268 RepID=A0A812QN59_9DINO|nr:unnamed protein product [Symbiodinium necroappetens]
MTRPRSDSALKAVLADFPPPEAVSQNAKSFGSLGHPVLCHRPCVYLLKGSICKQGALCQFCHHSQHSPMPKLDQMQRARVQRMTEQELLRLLIPHIREQARAAGLQERAEHFIRTLQDKFCGEASGKSDESISWKELCKLKKTLRQMNLTALIRLLPTDVEGIYEQLRTFAPGLPP